MRTLLFVPYSELSEAMKEHDRKWARKVLDVLAPALAAARAEGAAEAFERAAKVVDDRCALVDAYDDDYTPNAVAALLDGVAAAIRALAEKERGR